MNLEFLRAVLAVREHGSVAAAGHALGLTHSAISLRIKTLEQTLGCQLLDRGARPARLTPAGHSLLGFAREFERLQRAVLAVGQSNKLRGELRLGAVPTTLADLVPPALAILQDRHPDLELHVKSGLSGELALALRQGDIDAALVSEPALPIEGVEHNRIADEPLTLIAACSVPKSDWRTILKEQPFIWFSRKTWAGQIIERLLLAQHIAVRGRMEVDSLEAIAAMVRHELGVAIVPLSRARAERLGDLTSYGIDEVGFRRGLVLLRTPSAVHARLTDALIDSLREAASHPYGD